MSSGDAQKRLCDSQKFLDKRCRAYQRRKEATAKATVHLGAMVKRILAAGVSAQYLLMDSWFNMPATVVALAQHLKLAKEIQCRDFDALIAQTTIVFMRYMLLAYQCRMETDSSFGDLFYACCEEVGDISFMQALYRILNLAADQLKRMGTFCEKTAAAFFDAIMETALQCVGLSKNNLGIV